MLTPAEVNRLMATLPTARDRAIAAIGLYTGCRIREICTLLTADVYAPTGEVLPVLTVRKGNTKGQLATRQIPVHPVLVTYLRQHRPGDVYVFPSRWHPWKPLNPRSWDAILRRALADAGIVGASTHSFRRTCLTRLSNAGVPLRVIHRSLNTLQAYLEVQPEQVQAAIAQL